MNILLSGGWSYGNIGDEAIVKSTIHVVKKIWPNAEIICESYDPENFYAHHGIRAVKSVHKILTEMGTSYSLEQIDKLANEKNASQFDLLKSTLCGDSLLILAGGGYFNGGWLDKAVSILVEIEIAKACGATVACVGQSIGPFDDADMRIAVSRALNKCDYICVRDESTYKYLLNTLHVNSVQLGCDTANVISDALMVDELEKADSCRIINLMLSQYSIYQGIDDKIVTGSLIKDLLVLPSFFKYFLQLRRLIKLISKTQNWKMNYILSTTWKRDYLTIKLITLGIDKTKYNIMANETVEEMCQKLALGDVTISSKMHPIIISNSYGVPTIGISYNYKLDEYMQSIGRSQFCYLNDSLDAEVIYRSIHECLECPSNMESKINARLKKSVYDSFLEIREVCSLRKKRSRS